MRTNGGLEDRKRTGCELVLLELCDLEFAIEEGLADVHKAVMRLEKNVRELVAWLCQEFPVLLLASS